VGAAVVVLSALGCVAASGADADAGARAAPPLGTDYANIAWPSPSKGEKDAMPIGNGEVVANVWAEADGELMLTLAKADKDGAPLKLGQVRVKVSPNPFKKGLPFRQTLVFVNGAVDVTAGAQGESVKYSVWVDANRPMIHVQIRAQKDIEVGAVIDPPAGKTTLLPPKDNRVAWWCGSTGGVMFAAELTAKPGADKSLALAKPGKSVDLRVFVPAAKAESAEKWLEQAAAAVNAARNVKIDAAVKAHLDIWKGFWRRGTLSITGTADAERIGRMFLLTRWINASAGRGTDLLKPSAPAAKPDAKLENPAVEWSEGEAKKAFGRLAKAAANVGRASRARFPMFWGGGFDRLPDDKAAAELMAAARSALVHRVKKDRAQLFAAWPRDVSVAFKLSAGDNVTVQALYHKGAVSHLEVEPMMRTGDFVGAGPYRKAVRIAKAGPARMDEMIVFVGTIGADDKMTTEEWDRIFKKIAHAGLTGVTGGPEHLDLATKHGLKVRFGMDMGKFFNEGAAKYKDHPAIACVFLSDRRKRNSFPVFRIWADHLRKVGFHKGYDYITRAIWGDIEHFTNTVRPNMLDFYHYHWMPRRRGGWFIMYLNYYRAISIAAGGIPVMRCTDFGQAPIKVRQTMYASLACGVKAFHFWVPWNIHLGRNKEGKMIATLMDRTKEVAAVSRDMKKFSPILAHSICTQIAEAKDPNKPVPDKHWFQLSGTNLVMGIHEDDDLNEFVFVASLDIAEKRDAKLIVPADTKAVEKVSKETGKWVAMPIVKDGEKKVVKFTLNPADGELMRIVMPEK